MSISQTLLRLGVFLLLALPVVQCQTAASTPPAANKKAAANKPSAPVAAPAPQGSAPTESPKTDAAIAIAVQLEDARLDAVASDYASMALTDCVPGKPDPKMTVCNGKAYNVQVNDPALRAKLKQFNVGDRLRVDLNEASGKDELRDIRGPWSEDVSAANRLLVLTACALLILGFATAVTRGHPLKFIVGMDHRYSNSKTQFALWFWVALSAYLATVVFRAWYAGWNFFGAVSIPQHLLEISGLSAISYGGAKAITTSKVAAAQNPVPAFAGAPVPDAIDDPKDTNARQSGQERFFHDLLQNDAGDFDFGDFQMLLVTFVAVAMYVSLIFHFLGSIEFLKTATLPDLDSTILAGFGLGQGAYLAKKAGGNVGTS